MSFIATNKVYTSANKTTIVWIETELFLTRGGCVSCLRACFGARLLLQSYQYPNLSEGTDHVGGQLHGDKECPFSGVTKSGRVWRRVPESDVQSVGSSLTLVSLAWYCDRPPPPPPPNPTHTQTHTLQPTCACMGGGCVTTHWRWQSISVLFYVFSHKVITPARTKEYVTNISMQPWCSCWCQCVVTQPKPRCPCWCQCVVTQP